MSEWKTEHLAGAPRIAIDHCGSGPLVLFMHGIGGNRTNWHDQLPALAQKFHAVAWDARGYGASDDYVGALDFSDFSRDVNRVLDHFHVAKAHLVGLSMGGLIAFDFHATHPQRVATLTICDSMPGMTGLNTDARREFIRIRQEPLLSGNEPRDIAPMVAKTLVGKSAKPGSFERLVASMSALHKESYLKTIEATTNYAKTLKLENIRTPTHIVVGDEDTLTPPTLSRAMASRIAGARLTIIKGAGHLSNIEQPAAFNEAVLAFLIEHREPAA